VTRKASARSKGDRVLGELLEAAADLRRHGLLSQEDLVQVRAVCEPPPVYSPAKVAKIRTGKARMSQAVFAEILNVSVSAVQKWESPGSGKHPTGAAARLLQVIERKGVAALLDD
jgi:putative transcriptional regulator